MVISSDKDLRDALRDRVEYDPQFKERCVIFYGQVKVNGPLANADHQMFTNFTTVKNPLLIVA